MPWWLLFLVRYGVPFLLSKGVLTTAEAEIINIWYAAKALKTEPNYPNKRKELYAKGQENSNINR